LQSPNGFASDNKHYSHHHSTDRGLAPGAKSELSLHAFMNASLLSPALAIPETRRPTASSLDITSALNTLPYHPAPLASHQSQTHSHARSHSANTELAWSRHDSSRRGPLDLTRSFIGVASSSMPTGLTDDVDVDLRLSYAPSSSSRYSAPSAGAGVERADLGDAQSGTGADGLGLADVGGLLAVGSRAGGGAGAGRDDALGLEDDPQAIMLQPIIVTPRPSLTPPLPTELETSSSPRRVPSPLLGYTQSVQRSPSGSERNRERLARVETRAGDMLEPPRRISWGSIPTAPTPQRILARRARQAAAEEKRKRDEQEAEARRLGELTDQL
jgi:hypothetical protein